MHTRGMPSLLPCAVLVAVALSACVAPRASALHPAGVHLGDSPIVVPMDHSSGHVVVDVYLGDKGPYLFQVDTYASIGACLDDDLAEELGLSVVGTTLNSDGRNVHTRNLVSIPTLRLGDATFTDVVTLVDDYGWIGTRNGRTVDGLLGFALFSELLLTFDYPGSRLVIGLGGLDEDAPHSMPIELTSGSPDIRLQIGEVSALVGIDTGHGGRLALDLEDAGRMPLTAEPEVVGQARSVYSTFDVYGATLAQPVMLAGHRLDALQVTFTEGSQRGLMGHDILQGYVVSFDQRSRRVQFALPVEATSNTPSRAPDGQPGPIERD